MNCEACKQQIARGELLRCSTCKHIHHYRCVNMTTSFYMENKQKLIMSWSCPSCENVKKRIQRNDDTPVRSQMLPTLNDTTMSIDDHIEDDHNTLGHNRRSISPVSPANVQLSSQTTNSITLQQISQLLDEKLENNKTAILNEIKSTVQSEISTAIHKLQSKITQTTDALRLEQTTINTNIANIDEKIRKLEIENDKLKNEINKLQNQDTRKNDNTKRFVVYGLNEYYRETERDLEDRIIYAFQDTLNIDLTGYIEELHRIGRNGLKRPIHIELISKRMTKYIISQARFLKGQGLHISEYLDSDALNERRKYREERNLSRRNNEKPYDDTFVSHTLTAPQISSVATTSATSQRSFSHHDVSHGQPKDHNFRL